MILSIRSIALVALALTSYSAAGPIVQERDIQKRDPLPLVTSLNSLGSIITGAQGAVASLPSSGCTVSSLGVRTSRVYLDTLRASN
jgi:hypothetical protein